MNEGEDKIFTLNLYEVIQEWKQSDLYLKSLSVCQIFLRVKKGNTKMCVFYVYIFFF